MRAKDSYRERLSSKSIIVCPSQNKFVLNLLISIMLSKKKKQMLLE